MEEQSHNNAGEMFRGSEVKIALKGRCHIGVLIGSETVKISYTRTPASDLFKQIKLLKTETCILCFRQWI